MNPLFIEPGHAKVHACNDAVCNLVVRKDNINGGSVDGHIGVLDSGLFLIPNL